MAKLYIWNFCIGHYGYQNGMEGFYSGPNSAGGVSVRLSIKNCSGKTIKYISFDLYPKNRVGDLVACSIKRTSKATVTYIGPLENDKISTYQLWENVWYNSTINTCTMANINVVYTDGTSETLSHFDVDFSKPAGAGCYVATAVYGSYDCPAVWTLRRYRDNILAKTWYGRAFIRTYYAISPTLVKWFGKTVWFKKMWRGKLDRMVKNLQEKGVESTPYEDKNW